MGICGSCPSNPQCDNCKQLIDGGSLRKKVDPPIEITLHTKEEEQYKGSLYVISRVGMLVKTEGPRSAYSVDVNGEIHAEVSPVFRKEIKDTNFIAFDITKVSRKTSDDQRLSRDEYEYLFSDKRNLVDQLTEDLDDGIKDEIRDKLKIDLLKSELLDQLQLSSTFKYEKGRIRQLSGEKDPILKEKDMVRMMEEALKDNAPKRDTLIDKDQNRYVDIHSIPLGYQSGGFVSMDVTELVRKEQQLMEEQWQSYREVIHALTKGKLHLIKFQEIDEIIKNCEKKGEFEVTSSQQLKEVREMIQNILKSTDLNMKNHYRILLTVQEAITNALKHVGKGIVKILLHDSRVFVIVEDHGKGIQLKELPQATLVKGYSTAATLGQGFHLMTSYCQQLYLKSDEQGTTVILEFNQNEH
ncbi:ATP-binding protein [Gracilibacillus massiliensis]|uniref:ATP-binding protein n=1 Tax=Gracilibacillus massiliensis TaxID=1564956 RepID=UPI00071DF23B|nr:ATP-binding protein [Gracilibacillus massiliensis]